MPFFRRVDEEEGLLEIIADGELDEPDVSSICLELVRGARLRPRFRALLDFSRAGSTGLLREAFSWLLDEAGIRSEMSPDSRIAIISQERVESGKASEASPAARASIQVFRDADRARAWIGCGRSALYRKLSRSLQEVLDRYRPDIEALEPVDFDCLGRARIGDSTLYLVSYSRNRGASV